MIKKLHKLADKILDIEYFWLIVLKIAAVFLVISCIFITAKDAWGLFFTYSESSYLELEEEARRIVTEQDYNSKYELEITNYNNQTHTMSFKLSDDSSNYVTVDIDDIENKDTKYSIERNFKSKFRYIAGSIVCLPLINILFALIVMVIFLLSYWIILFITFIFNCFRRIYKKKHLD